MGYYFSKEVPDSFDKAIERVTDELKKEGFGILTEIDVKATLKKKIDVDFRDYKILGACNPPFAHRALQIAPEVGVFMPCNVVVRDLGGGRTRVDAMNAELMSAILKNEELAGLAHEVNHKLRRALEAL